MHSNGCFHIPSYMNPTTKRLRPEREQRFGGVGESNSLSTHETQMLGAEINVRHQPHGLRHERNVTFATMGDRE